MVESLNLIKSYHMSKYLGVLWHASFKKDYPSLRIRFYCTMYLTEQTEQTKIGILQD